MPCIVLLCTVSDISSQEMCLCRRIIVLISFVVAVRVEAAPKSWPPKLKSFDIWDAPPASGTSSAVGNEQEISQNNEFFEYRSNQTRFRDSRGKWWTVINFTSKLQENDASSGLSLILGKLTRLSIIMLPL